MNIAKVTITSSDGQTLDAEMYQGLEPCHPEFNFGFPVAPGTFWIGIFPPGQIYPDVHDKIEIAGDLQVYEVRHLRLLEPPDAPGLRVVLERH